MRLFTVQAFDEVIANAGYTWFSPAHLSKLLGSADALALHAWVTNASGGSNMVIQLEHSADGENWMSISPGSPEISGAITSNTSYYGRQVGLGSGILSFVRLNISLSGGGPQCRLKVHVTGRVL